MKLRTALATLTRQYNQGFLSDHEFYHAVSNLCCLTELETELFALHF